jgi:hypothetical protein
VVNAAAQELDNVHSCCSSLINMSSIFPERLQTVAIVDSSWKLLTESNQQLIFSKSTQEIPESLRIYRLDEDTVHMTQVGIKAESSLLVSSRLDYGIYNNMLLILVKQEYETTLYTADFSEAIESLGSENEFKKGFSLIESSGSVTELKKGLSFMDTSPKSLAINQNRSLCAFLMNDDYSIQTFEIE